MRRIVELRILDLIVQRAVRVAMAKHPHMLAHLQRDNPDRADEICAREHQFKFFAIDFAFRRDGVPCGAIPTPFQALAADKFERAMFTFHVGRNWFTL